MRLVPEGSVRLRKTAFLSHLYIETIILPRQARDKHRENSKKDAVFRTFASIAWASSAYPYMKQPGRVPGSYTTLGK